MELLNHHPHVANVVLPLPEGPTSAVTVPSSTPSDTRSSTRTSDLDFDSDSTSIIDDLPAGWANANQSVVQPFPG
jgi:hypothetical protein